MAHETVWQVFEGHFPGRLGFSNRKYERVSESADAAKEWFPPKAPARGLTSRMRQRQGVGVVPKKKEIQPVHRQLNDADAMRGLIRVLKEAEATFRVVLNPRAEYGQNETNRNPELRVFLHPNDTLQKNVGGSSEGKRKHRWNRIMPPKSRIGWQHGGKPNRFPNPVLPELSFLKGPDR